MESLEILTEDRSTSTSYHTTWPRLSGVIRCRHRLFFHAHASVLYGMCLFSCARACRTLVIACTHSLLLVRVHSQWCSLILRCTFILACAHSFSHAYTRSRSHALVLAVRVCFHWCLFSLTRVALTCTGSFVAVVHVAVNVVVNVVVEWM